MAPHSSTLAWKIPWMEEPGSLQSMGLLRVGHDWATSLSFFTFIGEGNGNPLQCSCLENPRDGGAQWVPSMGSHRVGHNWSDLAQADKVMLKILQARLQQYMNRELPDVQAGFRKGRGTEIKLPISAGSWKKEESSRKHLFLLYWLCQSLWLCGSQ